MIEIITKSHDNYCFKIVFAFNCNFVDYQIDVTGHIHCFSEETYFDNYCTGKVGMGNKQSTFTEEQLEAYQVNNITYMYMQAL